MHQARGGQVPPSSGQERREELWLAWIHGSRFLAFHVPKWLTPPCPTDLPLMFLVVLCEAACGCAVAVTGVGSSSLSRLSTQQLK